MRMHTHEGEGGGRFGWISTTFFASRWAITGRKLVDVGWPLHSKPVEITRGMCSECEWQKIYRPFPNSVKTLFLCVT